MHDKITRIHYSCTTTACCANLIISYKNFLLESLDLPLRSTMSLSLLCIQDI